MKSNIKELLAENSEISVFSAAISTLGSNCLASYKGMNVSSGDFLIFLFAGGRCVAVLKDSYQGVRCINSGEVDAANPNSINGVNAYRIIDRKPLTEINFK